MAIVEAVLLSLIRNTPMKTAGLVASFEHMAADGAGESEKELPPGEPRSDTSSS